MTTRNLSLLLLVAAAIFTPWWLTCSLLVGTFLFYQDFFEGIAVLFLMDLLYGSGLAGYRGYFSLTLAGLLFFMAVEACRKAMLVHD